MTAVFPGNFYGSTAIGDSRGVSRTIRDLGRLVWMPRHKLWAIGRYLDVRDALRADTILINGKGVAANDFVNRQHSPLTLTSDGETHLRRRKVLMRPVMPKPLAELRGQLVDVAEELVDRLARRPGFEAMEELAAHLPVTVVAELVGLNPHGTKNMLKWAAATFNALGAMNLRALMALPTLSDLKRFLRRLGPDDVTPGGWAARLFEAADRGEISRAEAIAMVVDYVAPALDTTILATGEMIHRLAVTEGAFESIRSDRGLIPGVVNESVRMASPIRGFTRFAAEDYAVGDATIPQGARVLVLFSAANWDERHYPDPDRFDVHRNPRDHFGWGHGTHSCVGMHLARLEMEILLEVLAEKVARIEAQDGKRLRHNVLQGFAKLPARLIR